MRWLWHGFHIADSAEDNQFNITDSVVDNYFYVVDNVRDDNTVQIQNTVIDKNDIFMYFDATVNEKDDYDY